MAIALPSQSPLRSKAFTYGVATSSFQIEGGRQLRDASIWDTFCATEGKIADGSNGDTACDHVEKWLEDIELIDSLGVDAYRFSISWPRIVRADGSINQMGLDYYLSILDTLNAKNIKAFVTLYHWDLPQHLEDNGGWLNRDTSFAFKRYADVVSKAFGSRVHAYATLNEPFCSAFLGYEAGVHAPGLVGKQYSRKAAHHLLLAHGLAADCIRTNCPSAQFGIVLNFTPCYAETKSTEDRQAANYADDYHNQWYIKPLFDGCYPDIIDSMPAEQQPEIHAGDMETIRQPLDFLGVNFYTRTIYSADAIEKYREVAPVDVPVTDMGWEIFPQAFTELLVSLNRKYTLPPIYITENGCALKDELVEGEINDVGRIDYYNAHLNALHDAMEQGVDVRGYFAWSLMDNFEWAEGYLKRFGLVYVDYKTQQRIPKASALAYRDFLLSRDTS